MTSASVQPLVLASEVSSFELGQIDQFHRKLVAVSIFLAKFLEMGAMRLPSIFWHWVM
jgi:hypothetical protein